MNFHLFNLLNIGVLTGFTLLQDNSTLQLINMILTIAYTIFSFILSIYKYKKGDKGEDPKISKWEKFRDILLWLTEALKDGKITKDEYDRLKTQILKDQSKDPTKEGNDPNDKKDQEDPKDPNEKGL